MHVACDLPADKGLLNYYVSIRRGIFDLWCAIAVPWCVYTRREQRTKEISSEWKKGRGQAASEFRVGDCIARADRSIRLTTARVTRGRHFYKFFPRLVTLPPPSPSSPFKDKSMTRKRIYIYIYISFSPSIRYDVVRDIKISPKFFEPIKMIRKKKKWGKSK